MRRRYFQIATGFMLFVLVFFPLSYGNTFVENKNTPFSFHNSLASSYFEQSQKIFNLTHSSYLAYESDSAKAKESTDVYGFKGKSLKKAFLFSLIVPGSGEFYAGSRIKAGLFFGLDVTLWALFFNYHGKGKDKEKQYKAYADSLWSEVEYKQWLIDSLKITSDTAQYWDPVKQAWTYLSHHLPGNKTQQYYEMIGKYQQFGPGWKDYWEDHNKYREPYLNMRHSSNDLLNKAKYSAMVSLANHILSSFDAAFSVKKYNKKGERFSHVEFKMRLSENDSEVIPRLSVIMRF